MVKDLKTLRDEIEIIDKEMIKLYLRRMEIVKDVALYKQENGMEVLDRSRELELLDKTSSLVPDKDLRGYYRELLEKQMELSRDYQRKILGLKTKVAYQGVEGAFQHIALREIFEKCEENSYLTFEEVFRAVSSKEVDFGVLPIENSSTGEISEIFDLLRKYNCYITRVHSLKIEQHLLGIKGAKISDIKEVYSHPQGFLQSSKFLYGRGWKEIPYHNTAVSAKYVSDQRDKTKGTIGSYETASLYNLDILAESINTNDQNQTKFIVISSEKPKTGDTCALILTVPHESGSLMKIVDSIGRRGYNMLNIKSRPVKNVPWEYFFFIEFQGDMDNSEELIEELKENSLSFKVVGRYQKPEGIK
ncbi:bifunctional chorismate mutase/prephenate dehydratase [uncultured Ilyobacter sp.]|jgi:chorismate mutase/prephenate dehydratase|uniref:bifunctional chorismate mutase/prephenate dehydratase n=1 Tax=uncultured Ilyobacter sp. TaxID=544433 RepID=UPI0029BFEE02|nr:bifunctional chorismate mutase/prephenate dehydratase [uncultured Ilyobacter sp.]